MSVLKSPSETDDCNCHSYWTKRTGEHLGTWFARRGQCAISGAPERTEGAPDAPEAVVCVLHGPSLPGSYPAPPAFHVTCSVRTPGHRTCPSPAPPVPSKIQSAPVECWVENISCTL